jgi:hypothetical protein
VLRLHHQTIITILEVLLYDPLYDWTVSTAEANKRQKDEHDGSEMSNVSMYGGRDEGGFRGTWVFFARNFSDFFIVDRRECDSRKGFVETESEITRDREWEVHYGRGPSRNSDSASRQPVEPVQIVPRLATLLISVRAFVTCSRSNCYIFYMYSYKYTLLFFQRVISLTPKII